MAKAQAEIDRLIKHPPERNTRPAERFSDLGGAMGILADVDAFRAKLAADRGMTLERWMAAEAAVNHPCEVVPITPTPRMLARRRMTQAGVPARFIEHVADKEPLDCDPLKNVRDFLNGPDGFRVISGGKGTRKTGSACWALGQLDGGVFLDVKQITRLSIEQRSRWDRILEAPLVVLDDLGTETRDEKGYFGSAVSELINSTYSHRRRLIVTCNMSKDTFQRVYGERELDRLREAGKWSTIGGQSVRQYEIREPGEEG